eukprot:c20428_g1_i2.p1 GENE.c20428_g1_i2~~c20428_g1_i2.p1  ORF type:complete len:906 (-),score=174.64 c20428_g1_i2:86-2803(-)
MGFKHDLDHVRDQYARVTARLENVNDAFERLSAELEQLRNKLSSVENDKQKSDQHLSMISNLLSELQHEKDALELEVNAKDLSRNLEKSRLETKIHAIQSSLILDRSTIHPWHESDLSTALESPRPMSRYQSGIGTDQMSTSRFNRTPIEKNLVLEDFVRNPAAGKHRVSEAYTTLNRSLLSIVDPATGLFSGRSPSFDEEPQSIPIHSSRPLVVRNITTTTPRRPPSRSFRSSSERSTSSGFESPLPAPATYQRSESHISSVSTDSRSPQVFHVPKDFSSITAALRVAQSGDKLVLSPGLYTESFVIRKDIEIAGEGDSKEVVIESSGGTTVYIQAQRAILRSLTIQQSAETGNYVCVDMSGAGEPRLENCIFSSRGSANVAVHNHCKPTITTCKFVASARHGCMWYDNGGGAIDNCSFSGYLGCAIKIRKSAWPTITNNKFDGQNSASFGIEYTAECGGVCSGNEISQHRRAGIWLQSGASPTIMANKIFNNASAGISANDGATGTIEENDIEGNHLVGIAIKTKANPTIKGNRINGGGAGVGVSDNGQGVIENNKIVNAKPGISVKRGGAPKVRSNEIYGGQSHGIHIYENGAGEFEGNTITGNAKAGVCVESEAGPLILRNRISKNALEGIHVQENSSVTIMENVISDNVCPGIKIEANANPKVTGNRILNGQDAGIFVAIQGQGVIENNTIKGNKRAGIALGGAVRVVVKSNTIENGLECGIFAYNGATGRIENNKIIGSAKAGVAIRSGADVAVHRNQIANGKSFGIFVYEDGKGAITENEITANLLASVCVTRGGNPHIVGNTISNGNDVGVHVFREGRGTIEANKISGHRLGEIVVESQGNPVIHENLIKDALSAGILVKKGGGGRITNNQIINCPLSIEVVHESTAVVTNNDVSDI